MNWPMPVCVRIQGRGHRENRRHPREHVADCEAAIEIIRQLAAKAGVVMENFRGGVMDRAGVGYKALSEINPKLIYCAISGFGQTGPYSHEAGHDGKIQALSGIPMARADTIRTDPRGPG
jgi:crotonobetainyl-CoA:carnitine CoA-transferase CaiB-like acyl-CoA transferase